MNIGVAACGLAMLLFIAFGAVFAYLLSPYLAIAAYVVWLVLFFRDVRSNPSDAFGKYRR